jgi:hypothetical protein
MNKLLEIKVGDELAFDVGHGRVVWRIHKVENVTPSGRIKCAGYVLNPDLTVRGRNYISPYRGRLVTDDIRNEVLREKMIRRLGFLLNGTILIMKP